MESPKPHTLLTRRRFVDACGGRGGDGCVLETCGVAFCEWGEGDDPPRVAAEKLEQVWGLSAGGEAAAQVREPFTP